MVIEMLLNNATLYHAIKEQTLDDVLDILEELKNAINIADGNVSVILLNGIPKYLFIKSVKNCPSAASLINNPATANITTVSIPGINLANDLDTAGGTPSGILTTNCFTFPNLINNSVDNIPIIIAVNNAPVPK